MSYTVPDVGENAVGLPVFGQGPNIFVLESLSRGREFVFENLSEIERRDNIGDLFEVWLLLYYFLYSCY